MRQEMEKNDKIIIMGEDVSEPWCDGFGGTHGLEKQFGSHRVRNTPISECGFIGAAVGAAVAGLRPIPILMFNDFMGVAFDQIFNQMAKLRYMTGGKVKVPVVLRTTIGGGLSAAAQHSQCLYAILVHIPGLKCVTPSTPYDAKGLFITALRQEDPTVFFEHKYLYSRIKGHVPEEQYTIPLGLADIKREGSDVTIVGIARTVHMALEAASSLEKENISAEVVDPRTLKPLDKETILKSVKKTGRLVVVDEANPRCGIATDIAAIVADEGFDSLDTPIKRVTALDTPVPFSPPLEQSYLPDPQKIIETVKEIF